MTRIHAIVPYRESPTGKSRLAPQLPLAARRALAQAMLADVLAALQGARSIEAVWLVGEAPAPGTGGGKVRHLASDEMLNPALGTAARLAFEAGAQGVCVVHADEPLLGSAEIDEFIRCALAEPAPAVSLSPCERRDGTNLLYVPAGVTVRFAFGQGSFEEHQSAYAAEGIAVHPRAPVPDVDTPEDLAALRAALARSPDLAPHTRAALGAGGAAGTMTLPTATEVMSFEHQPAAALAARARARRDAQFGPRITYSRKVFLPVTHLCRDVCHYCTFARTPRRAGAAYMSEEQVLAVARQGAALGCKEALFTLGDRPELRYRVAREELSRLGFASTLAYVTHLARRVLRETGLLPHINAGVMTADEFSSLRGVSASMGLMLESASPRLLERGMPHHGSPDKQPEVRLAAIRRAGEARVPFTSGLLIGIGETRAERLASLLALRDLHGRHGHLQEILIQNFRAKPGTRMAQAPEPSPEELVWSIAAARLVFGPEVSIQAPPNLSQEGDWLDLVAAGLDDLGGISPLTPDFVNPEAPWPQVGRLDEVLRSAGHQLCERLTVYPRFIGERERWLHAGVQSAVLNLADATGLARDDDWRAGISEQPPDPAASFMGRCHAPPAGVDGLLSRLFAEEPLGEGEITALFAARGSALQEVLAAADEVRRSVNGDAVGYVINRNINYTNQCTYHCGFCAFSTGKVALKMRDAPYRLDLDEIAARVVEARERGATEVCLQGGIHPQFTGQSYLDICAAVHAAAPAMHIHAFSPLEVLHGAGTLGLPVKAFLAKLQEAGLSTLPGTAAEILDDEVRAIICPDKLGTREWLDVMADAHSLGLRSTATILYGHVEGPQHWARHLIALRTLQERSGGFTEFVPLPFVAEGAPLYRRGRARPGPTFREAVLMHAVARLVLHPAFQHVQTSWVKMGVAGARLCLSAGADDVGGTLMNESISRAAGGKHGQEFTPARMQALISSAGRIAYQRTTLYRPAVRAEAVYLNVALNEALEEDVGSVAYC